MRFLFKICQLFKFCIKYKAAAFHKGENKTNAEMKKYMLFLAYNSE